MIKENNHMIEVWGHLHTENMKSLRRHLELSRNRSEFLLLSLDHVRSIDPESARALEYEYWHTAASNQVLTIIGRQNAAVHEVMRNTKTSYILSNDHI